MAILSEILTREGGAQFLRVDLHIHSFGENGSYDVSDATMTPQNIVDTAISKGLSLISITDHNTTSNVKNAIDYAKDKDILVIPGVELSTNEGHVLIYAENLSKLEAIVGAHKYSEDRKSCLSTMKQCIDAASEYGGFAIAAHIDKDKDKGFERSINGYGEPKLTALKHNDLLAFEISDKAALKWFTISDTLQQRKILSKTKVGSRNFTIGERARVIFSDSHKLSSIGQNINGKERVTRIKLAELNYQALKTAFLDPNARVRAEEVIPKNYPHFVGIKLDGGFIDGEVLRLNRNLNCIIGGRGSGKSTLIESIKVTSGNKRDNGNEFRLLDSEVWSDTVTLVYEDEVGNQQEFIRKKGDVVINQTDPANGITVIPLESYGQGETAKFIQDSGSAPAILTDFLDKFIEFDDLKIQDEQIRADLLDNHHKISNFEAELKQLPDFQRLYKDASTKLATLKKQNVKQLVELEVSLAEERSLRNELDEEIHSHKDTVADSLGNAENLDIDEITGGKVVRVGKDELSNIKLLVTEYIKLATSTSSEFNSKSDAVIDKIERNLTAWKIKEASLVQKIEDKKNELLKLGIKPDSAFISTTVKSVSEYELKIRRLISQKADLAKLLTRRNDLIQSSRQIKSQIFAKRLSFARKINLQLGDTIDYEVNLTYKQGLQSEDFCELLQTTMNWRTSQVPKASIIAKSITCEDFVAMVQERDSTDLLPLADKNGASALSKSEIANIFDVFGQTENIRALEELLFDDRPEIIVTKHTKDATGKKIALVREFHMLSMGQQQAIFLTILLHSGQNTPLIIDQPEDNLDSEFIYKTVVTTLRKIKEQRQVIVVTHNANIAVLGDAELIIPLRSSNDRTVIKDRGSIDRAKTKVITCTILEGGETAFQHRKDLYGL